MSEGQTPEVPASVGGYRNHRWGPGLRWSSVHFSSVTQSCSTLCDPMNHSTPGLPVHHQLLEFTQTHVHWVGDAIQPSQPQSQMWLSDSTTRITKHSNNSLDDTLTTELTLGFEMMGELCCFCSTLSNFSKMSVYFQYINFNKSFLLNVMNDGKKGSIQSSSVTQSCPTLCDPMNCSTPGLPVHHQLPDFTQTHVHRVGDAIQPSHPLLSPSPPALNLSQQQGLFQWVNSSHEVAIVLEFQLQHQSFQWTPRTDLL